MAASLSELIVAVFLGAPSPEAAARFSAQITALISAYVCLVAGFVVVYYIRRVKQRGGLSPERRAFRIWIAFALLASLLVIVANILVFYNSVG